jgi:hypothetical protein
LPLSRSATSSNLGPGIIWGTIAAVALLGWPRAAPLQTVDCIAAEVNGRAITLTDIRILRDFSVDEESAPGTPSPGTLRGILEKAIDRRVVIELMREDIEVTGPEADTLLSRWKERFDAAAWEEKLAAYGLREESLKPYLEEFVRYSKLIGLRFGRAIEIGLPETELYYEETYAPAERAAGREPRPLAEAASEIEARLIAEKTSRQAASWVRSLRAQAEVRIFDRCLDQARQ